VLPIYVLRQLRLGESDVCVLCKLRELDEFLHKGGEELGEPADYQVDVMGDLEGKVESNFQI
jgi:hypothetical protein